MFDDSKWNKHVLHIGMLNIFITHAVTVWVNIKDYFFKVCLELLFGIVHYDGSNIACKVNLLI